MTKLLTISLLLATISCASDAVRKEQIKSGKAAAASERLNASHSNTGDVFKELDEPKNPSKTNTQ